MSSFHTSPRFYARFLTNVSDIQKVSIPGCFFHPCLWNGVEPWESCPIKGPVLTTCTDLPQGEKGAEDAEIVIKTQLKEI